MSRTCLLLAASVALASCAGRPVRAPEPVAAPAPARADLFAPPAGARAPEPERAEGPLLVTASEAVLLTLQHNRAFAVERYRPAITRTFEETERAAFDPVLGASASRQWQRAGDRAGADQTSKSTDLGVTADERLPTGTSLSLGLTGLVADSPAEDSARLGLTVTQSLLRGFGLDANLADLRQARLDTVASEYELRGFAESLVAQAEEAYWDYALAVREIAIVESSLALAQEQLAETNERIRVGQLAEIERAAAEAEVALRRESEIDARGRLGVARLTLLRLLNPPGGNLWGRAVEALDPPAAPAQGVDNLEDHVKLALLHRPELNQARVQVRRGDLDVVRTRNGLLPKLDAFVALGKSGYSASFGGALGDLGGDGYDAQVGLTGELPWGNRAARASERRAVLGRDQAREAVENLTQLAQVDVRSAYVEAVRSREQVAATAATRRLQEEKLRAETEKFRVGKSTSLLVAQAQRDLLQSQTSEVEAVVSYLKALVEVFRQDGSLLLRRGIAAPGAEAAEP